MAVEAERLRQVMTRQEREMAALKDRALRAELEGERVKAELWELQMDKQTRRERGGKETDKTNKSGSLHPLLPCGTCVYVS